MTEINTSIKIDNTDAKNKIEQVKSAFESMKTTAQGGANGIQNSFMKAFNQISSAARNTLVGAFKAASDRIRRMFASLGSSLVSFIGIFTFTELTKELQATASSFIATENGLKAITQSGEMANKTLMYLKDLGANLGTDINTLASSFLKYSAAGSKSLATSAQLLDMFEALSETSVILQFSKQQLEGAFRAITQMMSKGKVQAEELRGQLGEHLPGAFEIAAEAMGLTTKELDKMLKQGQVTAEMLIAKLPEGLRKAYGAALPAALKTSRAEFGRLKNDV